MIKKILISFLLIISIVCVAIAGPSRSSSGSFGRSSPSRSSYSSPSKPSYSAPSRSSSGLFGSSSGAKSVAPKSSSTDSKISQSLKTTSKSYKTKESAIEAFKKENAGKYTSKYEKEPATRPNHIPESTTVDGRNVTVNYNSTYGGYGYMHPSLGTWIMYDMMSDAVMLSAMSHNHGYHVVNSNSNGYHVVNSYYIGIGIFVSCIIAIAILLIWVNNI